MSFSFILSILIKILIIIALFSFLAGFTVYVERKLLGYMQRRLGPVYVGPKGIFQFLADFIKLFTKEDIIPQDSIRFFFKIAPVVSVTSAFIAFAAVPLLPTFTIFGYEVHPIVADINIAILFVIGAMASGMYGPLLAGLSSSNKWSIYGGARVAIYMLSYEAVLILALMTPLMIVGSFSLIEINAYQGIHGWLMFTQPVSFILVLICAYVETGRTPFHLLEDEHVLVSGCYTEYSGMRWGLFFIAEYTNMFVLSFLVSIVFLGGFNSLWIIPGWIMIILKVIFFMFLFIWVRGAWPDVRPDQVMWLCWKVLMPIAVINLLITGVFLNFI